MTFARPSLKEHKARRAREKRANLRALVGPARGLNRGTYEGTTREAVPKSPADRLQAMRDLAMGEECQVRYQPVCRGARTEYTVLAHTNTQADQKGLGYKGHDSAGVFSCDRCHEVIDRRVLTPIETEEIMRAAQERTRIRLRFIARSTNERPWRVRAARWALERLEAREKDAQP